VTVEQEGTGTVTHTSFTRVSHFSWATLFETVLKK
jgi:hypothetical protein